MKPEKIRALYDQAEAATMEEAGETLRRVLVDPEEARAHVETLAALASTDPTFAQLWRRFLQAMELSTADLTARMADDTFALQAGARMLTLMEIQKPGSVAEPLFTPPAPRVERGRPKKARSA